MFVVPRLLEQISKKRQLQTALVHDHTTITSSATRYNTTKERK